MTAEETIASLEAQLKQALERLGEVTEQLQAAQARIAELEKQQTPPPAFVKAHVEKKASEEKKPRKQRDANSGSFASPMCEPRLRSTPYVSGSNAFYQNSLSLWPFLGFQLTTI